MSKSYSRLKTCLQESLGVAIKPFSVIDKFLHATANSIDEVREEIQKNKTPHIYSGLKGSNIDGLGMLVGCPRYENENDTNYLIRVMQHHTANQASNQTAIVNALVELKYSSHATYVPYTQGAATASIHFIPKNYSEITKAKEEIKSRLINKVSPDAYIEISEAKPLPVKIVATCVLKENTREVLAQIEEQVKTYINEIPIGETLNYGAINKIGVMHENVELFNTSAIFINDSRLHALSQIQTIKEKFVFDDLYLEAAIND